MYVCVCNAIRENELRHAARRVEGDVEAVYLAMGCEFRCRMCEDEAECLVAEERNLDRQPRLVAA